MKIEKNFYGEFAEEYKAIISEQTSCKADKRDEKFVHEFIDGLFEARKRERASKRARGLCLPTERFFQLAEKGSELAERIGLDLLVETHEGEGVISFTGDGVLISKEETPELLQSLVDILSDSDRLDLIRTEKYGRNLSRLIISFDLNEDI